VKGEAKAPYSLANIGRIGGSRFVPICAKPAERVNGLFHALAV
jgi:hypothetical protein